MTSITNRQSFPPQALAAVRALTQNLIFEVPALTLTRVLVGAVMEVRLNYPDFKANVGGVCTEYAAGTITLNTADVAVPTNHYIVIPETTGVITVTTTDPDATYGRNAYVYIALVRLQSVAGTEVVFYLRRMYNPMENLLNEIGGFSSDVPYTWVSGAGLTIDPADGSVDLEATNYRRWKFAGTLAAQTDAVILLDDEATQVTNLEAITTYRDGSAITAGKYHKIALLLICSGAADVRLVALRQEAPTVEYATLEEARVDAEERAANTAPAAYFAPTFPLAYVYMLKGDASDLGTIDLREPGFGGGGGGGAVGDHGALVGLGNDDHLQYLNLTGVRAMTGDLDMGAQDVTNVGLVDGVDIATHVANPAAHQDLVTLNAGADTVLALAGQEIGLDTQAANTVWAGPAAGAPAAPTFRAVAVADIQTPLDATKAYGGIYVSGGAAAQALAAATPTLLTAFTVNGPALNVTPDHTADSLTVTNAGNYRVTGSFTFQSSSINTNLTFALAVGGVASVVSGATRATTANQPFYTAFNGLVTLAAGNVLTVLATASGNTDLTVTAAHFTVERV